MNNIEPDKILESLYYNVSSPAAYGGVAALVKASHLSRKVVLDWLRAQDAYTLHKPAKRHLKQTSTVNVGGIDHVWQADLVDMQAYSTKNEGYRYILTVIDVFSKYGWAEAIKSKTDKDIQEAFNYIFNHLDGHHKPFKVMTDLGLEFIS